LWARAISVGAIAKRRISSVAICKIRSQTADYVCGTTAMASISHSAPSRASLAI
jgi:hypothetical protein